MTTLRCEEEHVKKVCFLGVLLLGLTPALVRADDDDDRDRWHHHQGVSATEIAGIGLAGAALVGAIGYAILRKRNISA